MKIRVLVVGCGNMGSSHALAYHNLPEFEICGIVSPGKSKEKLNEKLGEATNYSMTIILPWQKQNLMQ